jgi:undecaprenyl phosphate-alpha-L-ara4N flippase subunit ArnE
MSNLLLSLTILSIAVGQIEQKLASAEMETGRGIRESLRSLTASIHFWSALLAMGMGLAFWLAALASLDVSRAYPILGFSFVLTTLLSAIFLKEHVGRNRWIGAGLISLGVFVMALGG